MCVCARPYRVLRGWGLSWPFLRRRRQPCTSPGYTGPEGHTGGPPPTAWGGPSGNIQKHKGPPTASPSHPPRGHQGTHKRGDSTKPPQTHWVIAGRQVNRGRRRDCTWRSAACREFTTRMREGMFAHPLRGGRPPSRRRPTRGHPVHLGERGGEGDSPPPFMAAHKHTHPRAEEGLHENGVRSVGLHPPCRRRACRLRAATWRTELCPRVSLLRSSALHNPSIGRRRQRHDASRLNARLVWPGVRTTWA